MSNEIAINLQSLSKTYKLYESRGDRLKELINPFRKCYHVKHNALQDITFNVGRGEVVGIIGQNGSGKSTLLKILASVVSPTSGYYECNGRVTALLELGGGFNMELTGVENIYYLGAIQGYPKKEMVKRIDQILDFADIGEYAFQPVKTYSSGMYVRLAFSMAINIDPDILITDEALSVGDIRFQQKCYRKIREFKDKGKTILICTHSLRAVNDFCTKAIWLHKGVIREQGDPRYVTDNYNAFMISDQTDEMKLNSSKVEEVESAFNRKTVLLPSYPDLKWHDLIRCDSFGTGGIKPLYTAIVNADTKNNIIQLSGGENITVFLHLIAEAEMANPIFELVLNGQFGSPVFKISNNIYQQQVTLVNGKHNILSFNFTFPHIGNGHYTISFGVVWLDNNNQQKQQKIHDALIVEVRNDDIKYNLGTILAMNKATIQTIPFQFLYGLL